MPKVGTLEGKRVFFVYLADVVADCPTHYWVHYDGQHFIIPFKLHIASVMQLRVLITLLGLQKSSKAQMLENLQGKIIFEAF